MLLQKCRRELTRKKIPKKKDCFNIQKRHVHRMFRSGCGVPYKLPEQYRIPRPVFNGRTKNINYWSSVNVLVLEIARIHKIDMANPLINSFHKQLFENRIFVTDTLIDVIKTEKWNEFPSGVIKSEMERFAKLAEERKKKWNEYVKKSIEEEIFE
eukprot:TRINITY_DN10825_c0_g1_i1.p1 TRINITY_DN10825_c0_g1~~TRINITY_DN10825_c0_g1_i1.p1  ORF type:complete len:155 (+),score=19.52 TRINITY_DN10825_c0_g1_i1:58-522(+)